MDLQVYLGLAKRTMPDYGKDMNLYHSSTGVFTEFGEIVDNLKRHLFYKKDIDIVNLKEELGDICWYFAIIFNQFGIKPEPIKFDLLNIFNENNSNTFYINKMYLKEYQYIQLINNIAIFVTLFNQNISYMVVHDCLSEKHLKILKSFEIIAILCKYFEIDFNEVLELNIKKLETRYKQKNGGVGFSTDLAINRDLESERSILENSI